MQPLHCAHLLGEEQNVKSGILTFKIPATGCEKPNFRNLEFSEGQCFGPHLFFADPDPGKNIHADPDPFPGGILWVKGKNEILNNF